MLHFSASGGVESLILSGNSPWLPAASAWATMWFNGTFGRPSKGMDRTKRDDDGLSEERLLSVLSLGRTVTGVGEDGFGNEETIGTLSSTDDGTDTSVVDRGHSGLDDSAAASEPAFFCGIFCGGDGLWAITPEGNGTWSVSEEECASSKVWPVKIVATGVI
jgi:hypothetical protein